MTNQTGRPRKIEGGKQVSVMMEPGMVVDLRTAAAARNVPVSEIVRRAVTNYLRDLPSLGEDQPFAAIITGPAVGKRRWWKRA